jgi:hypothetical protein
MIGTSVAMTVAFGMTWSTLVLTAASERSSITIIVVLCVATPFVLVLKNSTSLCLEASLEATLKESCAYHHLFFFNVVIAFVRHAVIFQ